MTLDRIRALLAQREDETQTAKANAALRDSALAMAHSLLDADTQLDRLTEALDLDAEIRRAPHMTGTLQPLLETLLRRMDPRLCAVVAIVRSLREGA